MAVQFWEIAKLRRLPASRGIGTSIAFAYELQAVSARRHRLAVPETVMGGDDPNLDEHDQHPMAAAMQWVHRITTVVMEMVLPGIFGVWLDGKWGTKFIGLLGFALGLTTAITHLLQMTRIENSKSSSYYQPTGKTETPKTNHTDDEQSTTQSKQPNNPADRST